MASNHRMKCTQRIPQLQVQLGNYTLSIVLGVHWLYSIGKYSTNYQTLEMEFLAPDGKRVVLRGIPNEALGSATTKGMTTIFRHEDKTRTRKWPTPTHKTSRKDLLPPNSHLGKRGRNLQATVCDLRGKLEPSVVT